MRGGVLCMSSQCVMHWLPVYHGSVYILSLRILRTHVKFGVYRFVYASVKCFSVKGWVCAWCGWGEWMGDVYCIVQYNIIQGSEV